jgi:hypothetical protein
MVDPFSCELECTVVFHESVSVQELLSMGRGRKGGFGLDV